MNDDTNAEGIPLRDYFAGQYMAAALERAKGLPEYEIVSLCGDRTGIRREEIAAALAYRYADAMVQQRHRAP